MTTNPPELQQSTEQAQNQESDNWFKWLILLPALFALCMLALYFMNFHGGWGNQSDFGTFGDFLGGVLNPFLGFVTVGLLVWSLKMQMSELALSRQELSLTRQELKETKDEAALSRQAMQQQVLHLQREAKLNELVRLMSDLRNQYNNSISVVVEKSPELSRVILDEKGDHLAYQSMQNATIYNLLYEDSYCSIQSAEATKSFLKNQFESDIRNNRDNKWIDFENLLIQFSLAVIKYHQDSNSPELTLSYLIEAKEMLKPFQNVFWTATVSKQLGSLEALILETKKKFS